MSSKYPSPAGGYDCLSFITSVRLYFPPRMYLFIFEKLHQVGVVFTPPPPPHEVGFVSGCTISTLCALCPRPGLKRSANVRHSIDITNCFYQRCAYHAWRFDSDGKCLSIPQSDRGGKDEAQPAACAKVYPTQVLFRFSFLCHTMYSPGVSSLQ